MPAFLLGVVALLLLLWAASAFIKADPKEVVRVLRWIGGVAALLLAGFLLFRGQVGLAIPLGAFGLGLLGWTSFWPATFGARTQRSTGQASRVRTAFLEMELDHDTGRMYGRVLAGSYQGASLDALDQAALMKLLGEVDHDSRDLLVAYLDRREPGWRGGLSDSWPSARGEHRGDQSRTPVSHQETASRSRRDYLSRGSHNGAHASRELRNAPQVLPAFRVG